MRRSKPAPQPEFFPGFSDVTEIGAGSLATVYRAREIGTNRLVALKLLNVRDASPRALESFERESVALGAVSSHPNIVTLYRSFRAVDERPVLVLELCQGSVGDRMRGGAGLPVIEVVALGIKIAGALETAHRAGILHRDVKPQNILMTEYGEPALADFGVAMLQSSTQTTAGLFDFTTLHAAPELLEGGDTSAATDVYELASTLYQLIAGRAAFRAYDGESPASVILRILRDPVQPLAITQAPQSLSDLLLYAMSKDKGRRPPTAAEFAAGLAAVEVELQWPRTQFLIRDAAGGTAAPVITRLPEPTPPAARPPVDPSATPGPPPPPVGPPLPGPPPPGLTPAVLDPRPMNERVLVERQVIERLIFEPRPTVADDGWSQVSIVRSDPDRSPAPVVDQTPASVDDQPAPVPQSPVVQPGPHGWAPPPAAEPAADVEPQPEVDTAADARADAERAAAEQAVAERAAAERRAAEQAAAERAAAERAAAERAAAERAAAERAAAERREAERREAERREAERREAERREAERREAERREAERREAERLEAERRAAERLEAERLQAERLQAERLEAERADAERRAVAERLERERLEADRRAQAERVEAQRVEAQRLEAQRVEAQRLEAQRVEAQRLEAQRVEAERVEAQRVEAERVEAERVEAERRAEAQRQAEAARSAEPAVPSAATPPSATPPSATPPSATPPSATPPSATPPSATPPSATPPAEQPAQYPIPPSSAPTDVPSDSGSVPTWAFRAATPSLVGPESFDDLSLDPMSLRNKVTLRAGTASMTVDDTGLSLRVRMRRSTIAWSEVLGFEPRFDDDGRMAWLVVVTHSEPVELPATRRQAGEVRYLHALLDAYRRRAAMTGLH